MKTSNGATSKLKVLIVAAEASSSLYAERLLEHWNRSNISYEAFGIGSAGMEKLGFRRIGKAEELAVVGFQEVLSNFGKIYRVFHNLVSEAKKQNPDFVLLMDYPDFNFRLAKKLKELNLKIIYYISPQVWAWRQGRVHFIKKYFDKMLVLFPFEVDFYRKFGIDVEFVGHPLLDEINGDKYSESVRQDLRSRYGIPTNNFVLALMPGSRRSELKHHLLTQVHTAAQIYRQNENISVILCVAPTLDIEEVRSHLPKDLDIPLILIKKDPFEMALMSDFVLCASGTATLTVGLMEKPMAIMYKMNSLTVKLASYIMKRPKYFGMVNLILDKMVSKEFFQEEAVESHLVPYIEGHIKNSRYIQAQVSDLKELKVKLGQAGVTERVSKALLGLR